MSNKKSVSIRKILDAARQEATGTKTSSYITTTAVVGVVYILITGIVVLLTPPSLEPLVYVPLSFMFAIGFSPLRYGMEELIRQVFPDLDYNSHLIIKHLNTISYSSLTLKKLSSRFFEDFKSYLNIPQSAFIFIKGSHYVVKTSKELNHLHDLNSNQLKYILKSTVKEFMEIKHCDDPTLCKVMKEHRIKVIVPLKNNDKLVGALLLGSKFLDKPYTTKDRKVMQRIAPKIAFAIKNAYRFEKVKSKYDTLIDDHKNTEKRLRKANRQLKEDDKIKDEFVYVTTHELKNPVTAIKGFLSLILEEKYGKIPQKMQPAIKQVNSSNQQLISLLNNLLQIARNEAQTIHIQTSPVIICDTIDKVIKDVSPLADQKTIRIKHSCPNKAIKVMADADRLREIMNNLLSNAIKYSSAGTIKITHEIEQDTLITHVEDEGHGIPKKDQDKIFTRFFRVEDEAVKGIPGTGLGLFIVKQQIEKMNGKIWFVSKEFEGSTFSFSLPLAKTYA